jgi:hypothetical protein
MSKSLSKNQDCILITTSCGLVAEDSPNKGRGFTYSAKSECILRVSTSRIRDNHQIGQVPIVRMALAIPLKAHHTFHSSFTSFFTSFFSADFLVALPCNQLPQKFQKLLAPSDVLAPSHRVGPLVDEHEESCLIARFAPKVYLQACNAHMP